MDCVAVNLISVFSFYCLHFQQLFLYQITRFRDQKQKHNSEKGKLK